MPTSLSSTMPSWRLSTLQDFSKEIMSLWHDGACIWVYLLQYIVWKGPNEGPLMPWTLSQVTNMLVLYLCVSVFKFEQLMVSLWLFNCSQAFFFYWITLLEDPSFETRGYCCCRKLPNCTHLCPEICHPGQCPSPEKCGKKVIFPRLHDATAF